MKVVLRPKIIFKDASTRKQGISAMLRVKNGEDYLESSILSVIGQVDEIVCVYNDCIDKTESILCQLEKKYPKLIKVFHYVPKVYAPNTTGYLNADENSVHSLAYYYNFALSKTTYCHVFKLDDDEIFFPNILRELSKRVNEHAAIGLRGINLIDYKNRLYVNKMGSHTAGTDTLLFNYTPGCRFTKDTNYEKFVGHPPVKKIVVTFYHLKRCKKDRGINNYDIEENMESRYLKLTESFFERMTTKNMVLLSRFVKNKYPSPYALGFRHIHNSVKTYNYKEFNELEKNLSIHVHRHKTNRKQTNKKKRSIKRRV